MPKTIIELLEIDPEDPEVLAEQEDYDELANLIRSLVAHRNAVGLTQEDVARVMGVKQPTVSGFERTTGNPTIQTLQHYARAVGLKIKLRAIADEAGWSRASVVVQRQVSQPSRLRTEPLTDWHAIPVCS